MEYNLLSDLGEEGAITHGAIFPMKSWPSLEKMNFQGIWPQSPERGRMNLKKKKIKAELHSKKK